MTATDATDLYYDPYDLGIHADPYPVFRRLREEAPLYHNEKHDFYALSRFEDVEQGLADHVTFSSDKGVILEMIRAQLDFPDGMFICDDPPRHTAYRGVLSRVFTPHKMQALEPKIRSYCAGLLDPFVGADGFDFVLDLGEEMPLRVIGMLLGIPETDQKAVQAQGRARTRREPGKPKDYTDHNIADDSFIGDYIDWRASNPSDDLMTDLLQAEFEDEKGQVRRLTREEVLTFVNVLSNAGNETTNRLIGWIGKILGDHADQRRQLAADRSLVPQAIEEILRFEPPAHQMARTVTRDVEYYGQKVPAGSAMLLLAASGNRDSRAFPPDGDVFDLQRPIRRHLSFGYGVHFCLGAALARLEGQIALDEVLKRFPDWEVDGERASLDPSAVRGWASLPVSTAS